MRATFSAVEASTPFADQTPHDELSESDTGVIELLRRAQSSLSSDRQSARKYLTRALTLLQQDQPQSKTLGHLSNGQIRRLQAHIDAHLDARIHSCELAAVLDLSVSHFTRLFKNTFGVTPLIYLANYRIESACRIMLTTNSSLTDIALSHGFCDQSHFIRIFRRQTGLTPRTWRRMTVESQSKDAGPDTSCASHYG